MFKINKWHKGKSGKGYVVELCFYDEETKEWHNAKMYVPDAAQYAGDGKDENPAAVAGVGHTQGGGEFLIIKCYRKDTFTETPYKDKANKKAAQAQLPDASRKGRKGRVNVAATPSNDDIPF